MADSVSASHPETPVEELLILGFFSVRLSDFGGVRKVINLA